MFYSWVGLVSKNYEIERACVEIEREIEEMEQKRAKKVNTDIFVYRHPTQQVKILNKY